jgi:hypothetical protein
VGFVSQIVVTRLVSGRVATVRVKGVDMTQEVCIGQNKSLPGTTYQNAFGDFVTDERKSALAPMSDSGLQNLAVEG